MLAAATALLICVPPDVAPAVGSGVTIADLASFALIGVMGLRVCLGLETVERPALILFGAIAVAALLSTVQAADLAPALAGLVRYLQLFVLFPLAVMLTLRTPRDALLLGGAVATAGMIEGVVGVLQYGTGTGASIGGETVRAVGTFGAQEILGLSVVVSHALIVCLAVALGTTGRARVVGSVCALALVVPLVLSLSRGSWVATAIASTVLLVLVGWRALAAVVLMVTTVGAVLVAVVGVDDAVVSRFDTLGSTASSPDESVDDRYRLWDTAVSIWTEHPVTGSGIRSFPALRDSHAPLDLNSSSDTSQPGAGFVRQELLSPHNQYLLVLAEQGLLGFLALTSGLGLLALATVRRLCSATVDWHKVVGLASLGLLLWQLVQFAYSDTGGPTSVLGGVVVGAGAAFGLGRTFAPSPQRAGG